jgi:Tfp pilus assembly protein PilO
MSKFVISLLALVLAGAVFFVYTQPAYSSIKTLHERIAEYDAALSKSRELQELKRSLLARYNTFNTEQLDRLIKLLPDHVDNVRLVLDLDSIAIRYGMGVQNVVITRPEVIERKSTVIGAITSDRQKHDSLLIEFAMRGTYSNFVRFVEDVESSLRIVEIESLSVDPEPIKNSEASTAAEDLLYRYNISLRTYWLK